MDASFYALSDRNPIHVFRPGKLSRGAQNRPCDPPCIHRTGTERSVRIFSGAYDIILCTGPPGSRLLLSQIEFILSLALVQELRLINFKALYKNAWNIYLCAAKTANAKAYVYSRYIFPPEGAPIQEGSNINALGLIINETRKITIKYRCFEAF